MSVQKLVAEADKLFEKGKVPEGIAKLKAALLQEPLNQLVATKLAGVHVQNRDPLEAAKVYGGLAKRLSDAGKSSVAIAIYKQALELSPEDITLRFRYAVECEAVGKLGDAFLQGQIVLNYYLRRKKFFDASNVLPLMARAQPKDDKIKAAWIEVMQLCQADQKLVNLLVALCGPPGVVASEFPVGGDPVTLTPALYESLKKLVPFFPRDAKIAYALAWCAYRRGRKAELYHFLHECLRREPDFCLAILLFARVLAEDKRLNEALFAYRYYKERMASDKNVDMLTLNRLLEAFVEKNGWIKFTEESGDLLDAAGFLKAMTGVEKPPEPEKGQGGSENDETNSGDSFGDAGGLDLPPAEIDLGGSASSTEELVILTATGQSIEEASKQKKGAATNLTEPMRMQAELIKATVQAAVAGMGSNQQQQQVVQPVVLQAIQAAAINTVSDMATRGTLVVAASVDTPAVILPSSVELSPETEAPLASAAPAVITAPTKPAEPVVTAPSVTPAAPAEPVVVAAPVAPVAPVVAAPPVTPVAPAAPEIIEAPVAPAALAAPVVSAAPVTPVAPVAPTVSAAPSAPAVPAVPAAPAAPAKLVTPTPAAPAPAAAAAPTEAPVKAKPKVEREAEPEVEEGTTGSIDGFKGESVEFTSLIKLSPGDLDAPESAVQAAVPAPGKPSSNSGDKTLVTEPTEKPVIQLSSGAEPGAATTPEAAGAEAQLIPPAEVAPSEDEDEIITEDDDDEEDEAPKKKQKKLFNPLEEAILPGMAKDSSLKLEEREERTMMFSPMEVLDAVKVMQNRDLGNVDTKKIIVEPKLLAGDLALEEGSLSLEDARPESDRTKWRELQIEGEKTVAFSPVEAVQAGVNSRRPHESMVPPPPAAKESAVPEMLTLDLSGSADATLAMKPPGTGEAFPESNTISIVAHTKTPIVAIDPSTPEADAPEADDGPAFMPIPAAAGGNKPGAGEDKVDFGDDLLEGPTRIFNPQGPEDKTEHLLKEIKQDIKHAAGDRLNVEILMKKAERFTAKRNYYLARKALRHAQALGADEVVVKDRLREIRKLEFPEGLYSTMSSDQSSPKVDTGEVLDRLELEFDLADGATDAAELSAVVEKRIEAILQENDPRTILDFGVGLHEMGLFKQAESLFIRVVEEYPDHAFDAYYLAATSKLSRRDYAGAASILKRLSSDTSKTDLEKIQIYYSLGETFEKMRQTDRSKKFFKKVAEIDANYRNIRHKLDG